MRRRRRGLPAVHRTQSHLAGRESARDFAGRPTTLMNLTYAGQMIVGTLVAGVGASVLAKRST
ncbi:hypothetical protein E4K73_16875 [Streptomyces sp. IB201691-2A2]|nr:hypothetical protein E4K73_16875 [Streptomyces sp. IB201691-2A2]